MFELKAISQAALEAARRKAVHYRLLNQPFLAESICRDILAVDPNDQEALVTLLLCLCDQFGTPGGAGRSAALEVAARIDGEYERHYYLGLICERLAFAQLGVAGPGSGGIAYDWFRRAMQHYDQALPLRPDGNDDAVLRWNTCARVIHQRSDVQPAHDEPVALMLE